MTMIFIVACMVVWRICHFMAKEDGPFYFMWTIRNWLSESRHSAPWLLYELLTCIECSSVWVAFGFAWVLNRKELFLWWLGMSAGAMLLEAVYRGMLRRQE